MDKAKQLKCLRRLLGYVCIILFGACANSACADYEFTVEGKIYVSEYYKGELEIETNYNFTAEVKDCKSRIRVFGGWLSNVEYNEFGWDGKSSYMCVKFWTNQLESRLTVKGDQGAPFSSPKDAKPVNNATLAVYSTDVPERGREIVPVWLAYGALCHFATSGSGNKTESVWAMGRNPSLLVKSFWNTNAHFPGLLENVTDYEVEVLRSEVAMTNSSHSVTTWTNILNMRLPRDFQIVNYRPFVSIDRKRVFRGVGYSFRPVCNVTNFFPPLLNNVPTLVTDDRLTDDTTSVGKVTYLSRSGTIVESLDAVKKTEAYAKALRRVGNVVPPKTSPESPQRNMRHIFFLTLLAITTLMIWVLMKGIPKRTNT